VSPRDATGPRLAAEDELALALLPRLEAQLRELRPRLETLRRRAAGTRDGAERSRLINAALDELEQTLEIVRQTRGTLAGIELRLTRRFDGLLRRLRELEGSSHDPSAGPST
jgi:hypothetical protein